MSISAVHPGNKESLANIPSPTLVLSVDSQEEKKASEIAHPKLPNQRDDFKNNDVENQAALSPIPDKKGTVSFCKMTREQRRFYMRAMSYHAIRSALEFFQNTARTGASTLVGIQFSGILQTQDVIGVEPSFHAYGNCTGRAPFTISLPITSLSATQSLGDTLNGILIAPVTDITFFVYGMWIAARLLSPPIERCLLRKEDMYLKQIVSKAPVVLRNEPVSPCSTTAKKISLFIDLVLPLVFFGPQTALLIRTIQHVGSSFTLPGSLPTEWSQSNQECNLTLIAQIDKIIMNTLSGGNNFFSTNDLIGICFAGVFLYGIQALCDFHDGFRSKSVMLK